MQERGELNAGSASDFDIKMVFNPLSHKLTFNYSF